MLGLIALAMLSLVSTPEPSSKGASCASFASDIDGTNLDLAPPSEFVEVCGQNAELCHVLTKGYPPSSHTLGYFVLTGEWARYQKGPIGFTRYLIAQHAGSMSPEDLPGLKNYIRSQQANVPDHTALPRILESQGRAPIPVFEDADDSVAFGTIMKARTVPPASPKDLTLATTNAALVVKGKVLSLYAFWDVTESRDVEPVKELTKKWLKCLRLKNKQ